MNEQLEKRMAKTKKNNKTDPHNPDGNQSVDEETVTTIIPSYWLATDSKPFTNTAQNYEHSPQ